MRPHDVGEEQNAMRQCQTTRILPDEMAGGVFAASHFVPGAARGGAQKQASRLRAVRDLCCGAAEHARSYGTAASGTGKICCLTWLRSEAG